MFHVYDSGYRITCNPVSYNYLLQLFKTVKVPWSELSTLATGNFIKVDTFIIVREV